MSSLESAGDNIVKKRVDEVTAFIDKLGLLRDYNLTSSKIAVDNDGKLYSSWSYLSALERYASGQSRNNTIRHIENEIGLAIDLYNNILNDIQTCTSSHEKHSLGQLASSFKEQLVQWQVGINTLKQVYHDDEAISEKVGIIDNLINDTISRQLFNSKTDDDLPYCGEFY
tara:strand:- start:348 stop:857 length:510 start_codon:yes stop_codon:yes gene_type:complete